MSDNQPIRHVTLQFLAEPTDVNFGGKVHGGTVMKWIDQAGYACAAGWSGHYCVTVYINGIQFIHPIHIGMLVEVKASIIHTGRTSMHIAVDVYCRHPTDSQQQKTTHCVIIFVAVDENGKPCPVPTWQPTSTQDQALEKHAQRLIELRKNLDIELQKHLEAN